MNIARLTRRSALILVIAATAFGATACGDDKPSDEQVAKAVEQALSEPDATAADEVSDQDVSQWLDGWCDLARGMTRDRAVELMGEPTTEYSATEATPQLNWEAGAYRFTAFTDTDGVLGQLQGSYADLGASDREKLKCPEVRK